MQFHLVLGVAQYSSSLGFSAHCYLRGRKTDIVAESFRENLEIEKLII